MMNRRDFIKHLAILSAGAATLSPTELLAREAIIEANAIKDVSTGLVAMTNLIIAGLSKFDCPITSRIFVNKESFFSFGMNLKNGSYQWNSPHPEFDLKITTPENVYLELNGLYDYPEPGRLFNGGAVVIDQEGKRRYLDFIKAEWNKKFYEGNLDYRRYVISTTFDKFNVDEMPKFDND